MKKYAPLLLAGLLASGPLFAQNVAKVNGVAIPTSRADAMAAQMSAQGQTPDSPELRARIKDQLITYEILSQEANRLGLTKQPEVATQLEFQRQTVLVRAVLQDYVKKNPVTDADIKAAYDTRKAEFDKNPRKEYLVRHILVKTEPEAKAILAKLKAGAKFEELAKQSIDPGSKDKGGSLDWAPAETYVPEFSKVLVTLDKGKTTEAPVQSQFGWHIIRVDDIRSATFPPFDQVRPQLQEVAQRDRIDKLLADLRSKAKIE